MTTTEIWLIAYVVYLVIGIMTVDIAQSITKRRMKVVFVVLTWWLYIPISLLAKKMGLYPKDEEEQQ